MELYIAGFLISAFLFTGAIFADLQAPRYGYEFNKKSERSDLGVALWTSLMFAMFWPVGWIAVVCITGFLQHGWRLWTEQPE